LEILLGTLVVLVVTKKKSFEGSMKFEGATVARALKQTTTQVVNPDVRVRIWSFAVYMLV
jgi:hypothetical protein